MMPKIKNFGEKKRRCSLNQNSPRVEATIVTRSFISKANLQILMTLFSNFLVYIKQADGVAEDGAV